MSYDPKTLLDAVDTFMQSTGIFDGGTSVGPPDFPPDGTFGAVWLERFTTTETTLGTGSGEVLLNLRIYRRLVEEPSQLTEYTMDEAVFNLMALFAGNFDFDDANVRNLVPLGVEATSGEMIYHDVAFTIADIKIPLMVNDVFTYVR